MCSCVDIHTWSYTLCSSSHLVIFSHVILILGHWTLCWYSHILCPHVDIHIWSCISVGFWVFWYRVSHLVTCHHVGIYTSLWIPLLIFSLAIMSPCWYSHLLCISVLNNLLILTHDHVLPCLILSLGHVYPCLYWHFVMYPRVDILTCKYVPMLIFTLSHKHIWPCRRIALWRSRWSHYH